ncbi:MAG: carboxypeptidase regulatory-like domain-containing protein [Chloroflexota bacterium]
MKNRLFCLLALLALLPALTGCNIPASMLPDAWTTPAAPDQPGASAGTGEPGSIATPLPPTPQTLVSFRVLAPENTPPGTLVYLTVLDEVTGLALNSQAIPMEPLPRQAESGPFAHILTIPLPIGSVLTYRYERDAMGVRVAEHLSDGTQVRYRMYVVHGQGVVEDVVSRWTDTDFTYPTGRISGKAADAVSGKPLPNLLVEAGGMQTFTAADGSYLLEGLPPGTHNLIAYALDGAYRPFQQGARVAEQSTTPADFALQPAPPVSVVFVVKAPPNTLPVVPLRMAGNLLNLGNSFGNLAGGMSGVVGRMPVMKALPDGRYTLTLSLPAGADLRYKYSLGDGFWNAERTPDGAFRLRRLIVPETTALVEDTIDSWQDNRAAMITFDVRVPGNTPPGDSVSIQFNPLIGWTEPVPMWNLGGNRWAYILFSPLNLPGNFSYRYCRNAQCGYADDASTPGLYGAGRELKITGRPQTASDTITEWSGLLDAQPPVTPAVEVTGRGVDYAAGVEFAAGYSASWAALSPQITQGLLDLGTNWVIVGPTWSYGRTAPGNTPPVLAPQAGRDPLNPDLSGLLEAYAAAGLNTGLYPQPRFALPVDEWWATAPRDDPGWWPVWFEQYRAFIINYADLASAQGAQALVLGGGWLAPALPGGVLADGTPSGVPENAEARWRGLIAEVRSQFGGSLLWALDEQSIAAPPPFIDAVDQLYLALSLDAGETFNSKLDMDLGGWLDGVAYPSQLVSGKPLVLALEIASGADLQSQAGLYNEALTAVAQRQWISGFISRGYFPPARLQDPGPSVNGKPAGELLKLWYPLLRRE